MFKTRKMDKIPIKIKGRHSIRHSFIGFRGCFRNQYSKKTHSLLSFLRKKRDILIKIRNRFTLFSRHPRGEDFWLAGYEIATGARTWYHLQRNEWSVHYNISPDGTLFAGDGGNDGQVAHAPDGKWIYLFRPEVNERGDAGQIPNRAKLIKTGVFRSEKLVNMGKHDYALEPNVNFTPDGKWIVFRGNFEGVAHVYAVEVARAN